jgi:hypothetical protein
MSRRQHETLFIAEPLRQGLAEKRQRFSTLALRHNQSDVIVLLVGAEAPDLIDNGLDGDLRRHIAVTLQGRDQALLSKLFIRRAE